MTATETLAAATDLFSTYVNSRSVLMTKTHTRLIYPQRISFQGGSFSMEALEGGRIVSVPMSEIIADWESAD